MKFLFISKDLEITQSIKKMLSQKAVFFEAQTLEEAQQVLCAYGPQGGLLILVLKEGPEDEQEGLRIWQELKSQLEFRDLESIFITKTWTEPECIEHQQSPFGALAYLKWPFLEEAFLKVLEQVIGGSLQPPQIEEKLLKNLETFWQEKKPQDLKNIPLEPTQAAQKDLLKASPVSKEEKDFIEKSVPTVSVFVAQGPSSEQNKVPEQKIEKQVDAQKFPQEVVSEEKAPPMSAQVFSQSRAPILGDALVPGGAQKSPDLETLKHYLFLREQDVAALSAQLKSLEDLLDYEKTEREKIQTQFQELQDTLKWKDKMIQELKNEKDTLQKTKEEKEKVLEFQLLTKEDELKKIEFEKKESELKFTQLKEQVREEIRKIRLREKGLENQLEILKKDSELIVSAREKLLLSLKRKVDSLEFQLDTREGQLEEKGKKIVSLEQKLQRAMEALQLAEGLLGQELPEGDRKNVVA